MEDDHPGGGDFMALFATADARTRKDALIAVEGIPPHVDRAQVRTVLEAAARQLRLWRRVVEAQQDDGLERAARGARKYLKQVLKYFDEHFRPGSLTQAFDDLELFTRPLHPPRKKGRPPMPSYTAALNDLRRLGVGSDDARDMLRGIGVSIRRPD